MEAKAYSYIRFSSPKQEEGDSERRQIELSKQYAKEHNLVLDDQLTDRGLSAFSGAHRTKGHLGAFLQLVEQGEITDGSTLLVENLDRLSREQVLHALTQFTSIIKAGIKIVTLQDNMEYTNESINNNWAQLIISITYMARAHDESETKSKRLKATWEKKREQAINEKKILTRKVPAWIEVTESGKFTAIPERCKAVEMIYRMKLAGKGEHRIETEMNANNDIWKPPISKRNKTGGWRKSYIQKILSSRAVIGEFQQYKIIEDKREKVGNSIIDYFPKAIEEDLFNQVQELIRRNGEQKGHAGGCTGKGNNLFQHIVKCGLCGATMHYIDKGKPPKGAAYLHCDKSRRLHQCQAKAIRYGEFERMFIQNIDELNIDNIIPGEDELKIRINELKKLSASTSHKRSINNKEISNLMSSIRRTEDERIRDLLDKDLSTALDKREKLKTEHKEYEQESRVLSRQKTELRNNIDRTREIYDYLQSAKDEQERIDIRLRLRTEIKKLIEYVKIYPLIEPYKDIEYNIEPGIVRIMISKYIDRMYIKFRGIKHPTSLTCKRYGELQDDGTYLFMT